MAPRRYLQSWPRPQLKHLVGTRVHMYTRVHMCTYISTHVAQKYCTFYRPQNRNFFEHTRDKHAHTDTLIRSRIHFTRFDLGAQSFNLLSLPLSHSKGEIVVKSLLFFPGTHITYFFPVFAFATLPRPLQEGSSLPPVGPAGGPPLVWPMPTPVPAFAGRCTPWHTTQAYGLSRQMERYHPRPRTASPPQIPIWADRK